MVAVSSNWRSTYLQSTAFAVGAAYVGWVVGSIRYRTRDVDRLYDELADAFMSPRRAYYAEVSRYFRLICKARWHIATGVVIMLPGVVLALVSFYRFPVSVGEEVQRSLRPALFDSAIYADPSLTSKFLVVVCYNSIISLVMGTAIWILWCELRLVRRLRFLAPLPLPEATRARLRPLGDFHLRIATDMALGLALFVILFFNTRDLVAIVITGSLALFGIGVLMAPQLYLAKIVQLSHDGASAIALATWRQHRQRDQMSISDVGLLSQLQAVTQRPKFSVFGAGELLKWSVAQATAVVALIVELTQS